MLVIVSCVLIAAALAVVAMWRRRWSLAVAGALAAAGIVALYKLPCPHPAPPRVLDDLDAADLCRTTIDLLLKARLNIGLDQRGVSSRETSERALGQWDMALWFAQHADACFQTPETCQAILSSAHPTAREFRWAVTYVTSAMIDRKPCAETLPPDPSRL